MTYETELAGRAADSEPAPRAEHGGGGGGGGGGGLDGLLPPAERESCARRVEEAVQAFVDSPRQAMEMADSAFDDACSQLTEAIAERRRTLRARWQDETGAETTAEETEELRLLLRRYRDTTERLLRL